MAPSGIPLIPDRLKITAISLAEFMHLMLDSIHNQGHLPNMHSFDAKGEISSIEIVYYTLIFAYYFFPKPIT
jgi:hypothetical protein